MMIGSTDGRLAEVQNDSKNESKCVRIFRRGMQKHVKQHVEHCNDQALGKAPAVLHRCGED